MLANLVASLIAAEAIVTTEAKAKALRPIAEKMITKAQEGRPAQPPPGRAPSSATRRWPTSCSSEIGPATPTAPGGYTRILKLGPRHGDNAPMARIEFV